MDIRPMASFRYAKARYVYELMTDVRHGWIDQIIQVFLWILSLGYGCIVFVTRGMYNKRILKVYQSPKRVISVGNITMGGVGKTPLVIWLAKILSDQGLKVVVLSRGYAASNGLNDETRMFKEVLPQIPIMLGRDRKKSIQQALGQGAVDIFLADDAFQHWPLKRDLDIVVIDAVNPFGNGQLIPRGILRETLSNLSRVDIFVLTKTDRDPNRQELYDRLRQINPKAMIVQSRHVPRQLTDVFTGDVCHLEVLNNKRVVSFCAIGDPSSFEHSLQISGMDILKNFVFSDHHHYQEIDLKRIVDFAKKENINNLMTTHKDAVKIKPFRHMFDGIRLICLDIELEITKGQDEFIERILALSRH